jgi:histidine triad (HIT) family protein
VLSDEVHIDPLARGVVIFEPLHPVAPGHMLVVPRPHVRDATEDPVLTGWVMAAAARLAARVGDCNIITSVGPAATQTVFHLHVHVVPRRPGDGLALPWTGTGS